jgi:hypothetical protein
MTGLTNEIRLEARDITKRYPGTLALDGVTMRLHQNQVNVLIVLHTPAGLTRHSARYTFPRWSDAT